ncbi:MAG TPA: hypothetical protein HA362_01135 [Nanoarchaeota archaeon]|nr:hypothetical protein [Nanoarchaeota archaeon]
MEKDEVIEGLDIALASVGFMNPVRGYVILEAEDNGNGFKWSNGAVVNYCNWKYNYLEWTGLYAGFTEPRRDQAMMSREEAERMWCSWAKSEAEALLLGRPETDEVPVSVLHEAEHYRGIGGK